MEDVAGVYETEEIKESIEGTRSMYYSTIWVLDLAESGTFTLKEKKSRKHVQSQKYAPVPVDGGYTAGEWGLEHSEVIITLKPFVPREVAAKRGKPHLVAIPFGVQSTGDLVSRGNVSRGNSLQEVFSGDSYMYNIACAIEGPRFKRVE
jgi:hypothetical protein